MRYLPLALLLLFALAMPPVLATPAQAPAMMHQLAHHKTKARQATVYVTETGSKYHRAGCSSLRHSKRAMSLKEAKAAGYTACKRCHPPK